jgi:hypothetical protein
MKMCFRCSKVYEGKDRMLCDDCKNLVPNKKNREEDREHFLWYHTLKRYRQRFGKDIICGICKQTISVLSPIYRVGIGFPTFYHKQCYEVLEYNDSPETLNYVWIDAEGKRINTFEVI